jgi:hypothetical protein
MGMAYLTILSVGKLFSAATCTPARVVFMGNRKMISPSGLSYDNRFEMSG